MENLLELTPKPDPKIATVIPEQPQERVSFIRHESKIL